MFKQLIAQAKADLSSDIECSVRGGRNVRKRAGDTQTQLQTQVAKQPRVAKKRKIAATPKLLPVPPMVYYGIHEEHGDAEVQMILCAAAQEKELAKSQGFPVTAEQRNDIKDQLILRSGYPLVPGASTFEFTTTSKQYPTRCYPEYFAAAHAAKCYPWRFGMFGDSQRRMYDWTAFRNAVSE